MFNPLATGGIASPFWATVGDPRGNPNFVGISGLLPLKPGSSSMKIITVGGEFEGNALGEVSIIDLNDSNPQWQTIDPLEHRRYHHNGVFLPDANFLIVGGNTEGSSLGSVLTPELFDTDTMTWSGHTLPDMTVARNYHATALLLQNAKVWVAGGRVNNGGDVEDDTERRIEIYTPGYLLDGSQPFIEYCPSEIVYNMEYDISVGNVTNIDSIVLIKPPGYYMLFILRHKSESNSGLSKIPSEAVFVKLVFPS